MKSIAIIGLASVFGAQAIEVETPKVEGLFDIFTAKASDPETKKANTMWYIEGVKGYYDGYYKSFYKTQMSQSQSECLNGETTDNVLKFGGLLSDPLSIFNQGLTEDFNLFAEGAEIMENVSKCHFE